MDLEGSLEAFLGPGSTWGLCPCFGAPEAMPDEEVHVEKAVLKRQQEFRAGRKAAREALVKLGCPPTTIPVGFRREPIWPSGVVGSISHSRELAIAVVGSAAKCRGLGMFTQSELDWLFSITAQDRARLARILFSAKESVYKYQFPKTREIPDFTELELRLNMNPQLFEGKFITEKLDRIVGPVRGRWMRGSGHVLTLTC